MRALWIFVVATAACSVDRSETKPIPPRHSPTPQAVSSSVPYEIDPTFGAALRRAQSFAAEIAQGVELFTRCPSDVPACVTMTLHDESRTVVPEPDSTGVSSIPLRVRGRFAGQSPTDTVLVLQSYTVGMDCSSLGQATVAIVGFTDNGAAIVLTHAGPFTVDSSSLVFGCEECGRLWSQSDSTQRPSLRMPAWDYREVGLSETDLSYADDGTIFVRTPVACVGMSPSGGFEVVSNTSCSPPMAFDSTVRPMEGLRLEPGEWLYQAPGQKLQLVLASGACT